MEPAVSSSSLSSASLQPILALVGHPLSGNPTQYMLQKAFADRDLDWRYLSLEVAPDELGDAVRGMRAMGFCGGNCSDPHKQSIIEHLDRVSETAARIGVVNLILREEDQLVGENTEGKALLEALGRQDNPTDKRIILLGAGRIARAIGVELAQVGVAELVVVDRTEANARELAELVTAGESNVSVLPVAWEGDYRIPPETHVLINATSVGALDPDARLPLDLDTLTSQTIVADVTFNPPRTWLLCQAAERGCTTLDGLEVFVDQAAINFRHWTGIEPDRAVMREAVEEFLEL